MHHQVEEIMYTFWIAVLLIAACNSSLLIDSPMTSEPSEIPTQTDVRMRALAAGEFRLPAASAFGEKGFHEVLVATHTVPQDLRSTTGSYPYRAAGFAFYNWYEVCHLAMGCRAAGANLYPTSSLIRVCYGRLV
jgi:hypothetical protein